MKNLLIFVFVIILAFPATVSAEDTCCVTMMDVTSTRVKGGVLVEWETAMELWYIGYNVLMERNGKLVQLNDDLILAEHPGELIGAAYQYRVRGHRRAVFWVEVVRYDFETEMWRAH